MVSYLVPQMVPCNLEREGWSELKVDISDECSERLLSSESGRSDVR